ncbi:hypothetical protein [Paludifilum halophilum]|uniref:Uncharacterized protein n=1 Tax=Paludifilum halophilum TaxID=1642702 RepID=A0A235B4D7_9BACL|nr:hypothetical protein [Paludifilum halophilum]OYD07092.1 hypothetical protein CHM34_11855 [Paludifilum halophilum]
MLKRIVSISLSSFVAGATVQFMVFGLYVSALVVPQNFSVWFLLTLYAISETVLLCTGLHFVCAVPLYSLILRNLRRDERRYYPLCTLPVGILFAAGLTWMTGEFDERIFTFLLPAGLIFGILWWNRIEVGSDATPRTP